MFFSPDAQGFEWSFAQIFWVASLLALKWIPGMTAGAAQWGNSALQQQVSPLTEPVSAPEAAAFLAQSFPTGSYNTFYDNWVLYVTIVLIVSFIFSAIIIYCAVRILQIRSHERREFESAGETIAAEDLSRTQLRWNRVREQASSGNEQNWRLAILEADIMLNELLDLLGYKGETMGDKMKQVNRGDFNTIDLAWEAHRVRNSIAHHGMERILSEREVRRVIGLYERVFREFNFVA